MKVKSLKKILLSMLTIMFLCSVAEVKSQDPVTLQNTVTHLMYSEKLQQHYLIDVFLPKGYQPKESEFQFPKYPVLYVLNSRPNAVTAAMLRHVSEMSREIIIGIDFADKDGHPMDSFVAYTRDLTPTSDESWAQAATVGSGGHAEDFLYFIDNKVKPFINETYNVNKYNQTLIGHSFGGLFGMYVLFNHSDSFNRYVIASPSLWWDEGVTFEFEQDYASTHTNLAKKVFISVGSKEFVDGPQGMIDNTYKMVKSLKSRNYPDFELRFKIFEDETHESVVGISFQKGIEAVFQ